MGSDPGALRGRCRQGCDGLAVPLAAGQHTTSIHAGSNERWQLTATYSSIEQTPWGVNKNGQTYGVQNSRGTPDLIAVIATNGKTGYALSKDVMLNPPPRGPGQDVQPSSGTVPVSESDGETVIGAFDVTPTPATVDESAAASPS
jgi:hypothetical protein